MPCMIRFTPTVLCLATLILISFAPQASSQLVADLENLLDQGPGAAPNDRFGGTVARGDFNGDGWHDLAVTASGLDVDGFDQAGGIFIYYGAEAGLATTPGTQLTVENALPGSDCTRPELLGRFGSALAVADFNRDGFEDLAVGAHNTPALENGEQVDSVGAVSVFWGAADSTLTAGRCFMPGRNGLPGQFESFGQFGFALATGDFEGDGYPDLAIGAPRATVVQGLEGTVTVVYSRLDEPLTIVGSQLWHQDSPGIAGTPGLSERFGAALASGDLVLGLDTACDLVIGVPDDDLNSFNEFQGSVHVIFGCTDTGLSSEDSVQWTADDCLLDGSQPDAGFGAALAIGNFDGLDANDLAIGAPRHPITGSPFGSVCVLYGNQQEPAQVTSQVLNKFEVTETFIGDAYGAALATFSVAGQLDHLLVGAPGTNNLANAPSFLLYEPEPAGGFDGDKGFLYEFSSNSADHDLGITLTSGRFDARGPLVAVGAPRLERNGINGAGAVWQLRRAAIFSDGFESGDFSQWSSVID